MNMGRWLRSARLRWVCSIAAGSGALAVLHGASAALFPNLYQVTVITELGRSGPRDEVIRIAMAELLTRVTGRREAATDPVLAPLLQQPENYVSSYGSDLQGRPLVGFAASRVDEALTALNWPVWPPERPLTLLWVAVDNGLGERAVLGADETAAASSAMTMLTAAVREEAETVALERGLPIDFPLLDLEDMTLVNFTDVWGGFEEPIQRASARYRADALLIVRVRPGLFGNDVQCLHLHNGVRRSTNGTSIRECLDTVGDVYAAELSVVGGASMTRITVLDVGSLGDYGRTLSYLEGLSVLQSVDVESLENGVLTLRVAARGEPQVLERVLALGGVLRPVDRVPLGSAPGGLVLTVARPDQAR
jgi:hypothetical protein